MLKYKGRFRVLYECDVRTGKPQEFTYIPCRIKKGSNICRHSETMLNAYITSAKIIQRLLREHPDIFTMLQDCDYEGTLLFPESRIDEVAPILKIQTSGRTLSSRPKYTQNITPEERERRTQRIQEYNAKRKRQNESLKSEIGV